MVDLARVLFPDLRYAYMPSVSLTLMVNLYFYFILNKPCPYNRVNYVPISLQSSKSLFTE